MGLSYVDIRGWQPGESLGRIAPIELLTQLRALPLASEGRRIEMGVPIETEPEGFEAIRRTFADYEIHFSLISASGLVEGWQRLQGGGAAPETAARDGAWQGFRELESALGAANPKDLFMILIQAAAQAQASDVHVEPEEASCRIRFRIDGVLHPVARLAADRYKSLLADLQIRSGMKWGLGEPQGGRLSLKLPGEGGPRELDIRIETVPALHGEDIVLRLFHLEGAFLELERLGLPSRELPKVQHILERPHGMVLTVGPTGSGKTSTLYALLNRLNSVERKIVTLEDPVEYELTGVTQIPVDSGKETFATMLRSVLREDPDVVMIGEIRDADTAKTALQASLTGHLMLSSFHGIDTAAAITRLADLTGEQVLVTSALRLVAAQRLVRQICPDCLTSYAPSEPLRKSIEQILSSLPEDVARPEIKLFRGKGCAACHYFGYRGRIGLFEVLSLSDPLRELITQTAPADKLRAQARSEGMLTLEQDGILKALEGKTTVEEVFRVVGQ
jgi:type II secretory ATPase GspE/PulE/Tfp pilus assembly ATPase PilB-like protein